jgi:7-cyano-7-deazaguanine synthase
MTNGCPRAVVLLSGGLDSTTVLAMAQRQGFEVYALSFRYGQRHAAELDAARVIAARAGVARHVESVIDLRLFGGSALTADIDVPKGRATEEMESSIPVTYVPARNTIFLSYALAFAEVVEARDIFLGVNALDYSGYPDCRPEYLDAFRQLANLATRAGVEAAGTDAGFRIHAPLLHWSKAEIIRTGLALGIDYGATRTCYDPDDSGAACGECDACKLRIKGFCENGLEDPAPYAPRLVA